MLAEVFARFRRTKRQNTLPLDRTIEQTHIVALDCETTGLDPRRDRIVSLATVPIRQGRCLPESGIDRLIDPGHAIPERSSAVHGIYDADVAGAPAFATVFPEIEAALDDAALLGHEIGFDLAMIRRETRLSSLAWVPPPALDTLLLYAAAVPDATDLRLEAIAARLGVTIHGRHTARGDALATAEIFLLLLPPLARCGATTLGDLLAICREQHRALRSRLGPRW